ncbi:hypothetical protein SNE40_002209 [Patella caerulea]|uniref:Methyltransferase-like protein 15 homolog n=2 Tax=Patella caerulea TaxID=87958 RepID=A0AAN8PZM4_PATCE
MASLRIPCCSFHQKLTLRLLPGFCGNITQRRAFNILRTEIGASNIKNVTFFSNNVCTSIQDCKVLASSPVRSVHDEKPESNKQNLPHTPVMLDQVLKLLNPLPGQTFLDMTFGAGGHSSEVLAVSPNTRVLALDRDPTAYHYALELQEKYSSDQLIPLLGRFSELEWLLTNKGIKAGSLDSVLFDVGASSMQFDRPDRGFALSKDGPLDMRMDGNRLPDQPSAADVINMMSEPELYRIIKKYGEEHLARKIANIIVESRYAFGKITTTKQLANIISSVFTGDHRKDKLMRHSHVATKTFQALRIFVNNELNELNNGIEIVHKYLKPGGVCVVLTFHSLEDRIVKRHFHGISLDDKPNMSIKDHFRNSHYIHSKEEVEKVMQKRWQPLSKKLMAPRYIDCLENPRARSAKLRAAFKLDVKKET